MELLNRMLAVALPAFVVGAAAAGLVELVRWLRGKK